MPSAPVVGQAFSPLDEELALLPGTLTPSLVEDIVRLGTWMPFLEVEKMVGHFRKVEVSEPSVRRATEKSGEAYVEVQRAQVEALERELTEAPPGPTLQQLSVDGAMVPLVHKEWAEVKTLAIGTVGEPMVEGGEWVVHTRDLSYFSRLADHESFARWATVETHQRGTEKAGKVCGVVDGAEWEQKFIDLHRPDAVRILDWGHAAQYVAKAGQVVFGGGMAATSDWVGVQLHQLKHGDPQKVLGELGKLREQLAAEGEAWKTVKGSLEYLEKRQEQIQYAEFRALGYPIGSGAVESANKLVVEARLKGSGMHWAREHVNPMVALRNIACSDRWEEAWPQISQRLREKAKERSAARRSKHCSDQTIAIAEERARLALEDSWPLWEAPAVGKVAEGKPLLPQVGEKPKAEAQRPAANHPWRRMPIGRAKRIPTPAVASAET